MKAGIFLSIEASSWEGMDPFSGPCIADYSSFHVLFHSFVPS